MNRNLNRVLQFQRESYQEIAFHFVETHKEIRRLCPDCKPSKETGTVHGYTCPKHFQLFNGFEMPTLGEVNLKEN